MPFVSRLPDELSLNLKQLFTSSISNKAGKNTNYSNHIIKSYCKTMNFIVTPNFSKKVQMKNENIWMSHTIIILSYLSITIESNNE